MSVKRVFFQTEEVVRKTKVGYMTVETDFVQMYHNAWRFMIRLTGLCSRDFLLWVLAKTNENNQFTYSDTMYQQFISDLREAGSTNTYAKNTLTVALQELVEKQIFTRLSRGVYMVNPGIFWSGTVVDRLKTIKLIAESKETSVMKQGEVLEAPSDESIKIDNIDRGTKMPPSTVSSFLSDEGLFTFDTFND